MRFTKLILLPLLLPLLLASSSCFADSQQQQYQQSVQSEQSHSGAGAAGENSEKSAVNAEDKSQNKRGAPIVVGTPAQHTAYINHHVVAAPISGHTTHAALGAVPFGYGHTVTSGGHILQTPAAAAVATGVPQHVLHKVSYVGPATATTTTTTVRLAGVPGGLPHLAPVPSSAGSPLLAKYNYAVPQVTYTHYPAQYQLVHHHQTGPGGVQPATLYAAHALHEHPVGEIATHHQAPQYQQQQQQQQQQTAYAHQQPIYAHHPAAIHYSLALPGQHNYAGQLQQQQQQQHPLSHTQAIHYQQQAVGSNLGGQQPAVPIVHQAPIAAINQVHQAQQVYAAQGQLSKYPLAATSLYGAAGLQNQIYSTVPSYAYHQHTAAASNGLASKQLLPTAATPVHLKSLVPLTTATTTQHHGNGISYTAFTQPSHAAAHLKPLPQGVLQTQPSYYGAAASSNAQQQQPTQQQYQQQAQVYYRNQLQQHYQQQQQQQPSQQQQQPSQQQQQQQRIQIYSTVASPLQKAPILYGAGQFSHPVPSQYAAYPYGNQPQPQQQQQQQQHQQQQQSALFQAASQQSLGKITYAAPVGVHNAGGTGAFGGRGSIYLLH